MAALPPGSLILVTGASGHIGSHVVNEALLAGYKVRGTARTRAKCDQKERFFHHANYSYAELRDFSLEGAFDEAMRSCDAVIHVASDMTFGCNPHEVVTPVVAGTENILRSAARESSVKRFVLTSSSCAVLAPSLDKLLRVGKENWNLKAVEDAWRPEPYTEERASAVYAASKTEGERAMWRFMEEQRPHFVANAILPNVNFGRVLSSSGVTGDAVRQVLRGRIPSNIGPQYMIDVIDNARLHIIAAVMDPSLTNDRIFAFNTAFNWTDVVKAIEQLRPNVTIIATPPDDEPRDFSEVPNEQGAELLKKWYGQETGYKPFIQTIEENLEGCEE